jgi:renalase
LGLPIAIVGAGLAGLSAARHLKYLGHTPVVFEKSRGLGGRMATRRVDHLQFDHGAQYFTARDAEFKALVSEWLAAGTVAEWSDGVFVGAPGMTAPARALADGIEIVPAVQVSSLKRQSRLWTLVDVNGRVPSALNGLFAAVLLAVPAPQAEPLAASANLFAHDLHTPRMAPCWALLLSVARPLSIDAEYLRPQNSAIAWLARDSGKPGRRADSHSYVLHATPEWSRANLDLTPPEVVRLLNDALVRVLGHDVQPTYAAAHRWRYALVEQPLGRDFIWDRSARVGACGDWCIGARIENAYLSGVHLAEAVHADLDA